MNERIKLPEIRCTQEEKDKVMAHVNTLGMKYSHYVKGLIEKDMKQGSSVSAEKVDEYDRQIEVVTVLLPRNLIKQIRLEKVPLSMRIRKIVMSYYGKKYPEKEEIDELIRANNQLVALGRNLNQLARKANAGESVIINDGLLMALRRAVDEGMIAIKNLQKTFEN